LCNARMVQYVSQEHPYSSMPSWEVKEDSSPIHHPPHEHDSLDLWALQSKKPSSYVLDGFSAATAPNLVLQHLHRLILDLAHGGDIDILLDPF